ncbi:MAG: substrate-binding domain-containing protein [Planctomycetales bacterium]
MTKFRLKLAAAICIGLVGCTESPTRPAITLATTTSTRDSGLLDILLPAFEKQTGIPVQVVAVGTGQALAMGRRGDADVLLTHAPAAEQKFMDEGQGVDRRNIMHNDFVLLGPESDPAQVRAQQSVTGAFKQLARHQHPFVSRGDDSGTHIKELSIWDEAQLAPQGDWYLEAGGGMAQILRIANEKQAYTLSDRGTFLTQSDTLKLSILLEGDPLLQNPYAIIVVSSDKHPKVDEQSARRFVDYLISEPVQKKIGQFGLKKFGQQLFFPLGSDPGTHSGS